MLTFTIREKLIQYLADSRARINAIPYVSRAQITEDEFHHVVMVVIAAILNPCKHIPCSINRFSDSYSFAVETDWDVKRYADRVKNSQVNDDGHLSLADMGLSKYFPQANFGDINLPATILDREGRIIAWHLPGIMSQSRVVCFHYNATIKLALTKFIA
jgi:hypothetical protein